MKNLSKFGVQELDAQEIKKTDGGLFWVPVIMIGAAILTSCSGAKVTLEGEVKRGDTSFSGSITIDKTSQPKDSLR